MAGRPQNISDAMREAFNDRRIAAAWNMFAVAEGADQIAALGGVTRLLDNLGLSLADIAEALTDDTAKPLYQNTAFVWPDPAPQYDPRNNACREVSWPQAKAEGGSFAGAKAAPHKPAVFRSFIHGMDVPEMITGFVTYVDEGTSRSGRMLTINVECYEGNVTTVYGPLVVFSQKAIALIDAANKSVMLTMRIRPAPRPEFSPAVQAAWAA